MKTAKKAAFAAILALFAVLCALLCTFSQKSVSADTESDLPRPQNSTYIDAYDITMDVERDRSIKVVEDITVFFYNNSGFFRDIPVNAGEIIKNVKVTEVTDGEQIPVLYKVSSETDDHLNSFLTIDIGDYRTKYREFHTYRIEYDYFLTKAQEGNDLLALTPVGAGWECSIYDITIKLILPDGYINDGKTSCFTDGVVSSDDYPVTESVSGGRGVLSASIPFIREYTAVRFDVHFEEGVLSTYFDFTPYICVIAAVVLLLALVAVKFLVFNKDHITPVINLSAPKGMDPLLMGKLIDGQVDSEDITSLIFYFADKGYLKINMDDEKNPTLIRIFKKLPDECANYEKATFEKLFSGKDAVTVSELQNSFYKVIPTVTSMVNAKTKQPYSKPSMICALVFAVVSGLFLGIVPLSLAMSQISHTYIIIAPFIAVIPSFVIFALSQVVKTKWLKYSKGQRAVRYIGIIAICVFVSVFYVLLVPSAIVALPAKILLCAVCSTIAIISPIIISRTDEYVKQLNDIAGFKQFIELAEKPQLEAMLEEDPQLYYHVLPYAQVLGVSDKWEEKFRSITIQPPDWYISPHGFVGFIVFNRMMRGSFTTMSKSLASRPVSSGASGMSFSGGGGSFGGHSGGGHGGGGGRFR